MKLAPAALLLLACPTLASAEVAKDHPIAGVIQLLEKLEVQAQTEGETEANTYQKFQYWCKRSTKMLKRAIRKEKKTIQALDDKISGLAAAVDQYNVDISELEK
jgi:flagellar biosynthesis chaperone FliJ